MSCNIKKYDLEDYVVSGWVEVFAKKTGQPRFHLLGAIVELNGMSRGKTVVVKLKPILTIYRLFTTMWGGL